MENSSIIILFKKYIENCFNDVRCVLFCKCIEIKYY